MRAWPSRPCTCSQIAVLLVDFHRHAVAEIVWLELRVADEPPVCLAEPLEILAGHRLAHLEGARVAVKCGGDADGVQAELARRALRGLEQSGILGRTGRARGTRYVLRYQGG